LAAAHTVTCCRMVNSRPAAKLAAQATSEEPACGASSATGNWQLALAYLLNLASHITATIEDTLIQKNECLESRLLPCASLEEARAPALGASLTGTSMSWSGAFGHKLGAEHDRHYVDLRLLQSGLDAIVERVY
ncbi:MAG: hypothetical protein ABI476_09210, partial [Oxalobacteraceae bacterium]